MGRFKPFGQAGEPTSAGPGRASPGEVARRPWGWARKTAECQRKVPGGVAEELEPLAGRGGLRGEPAA